MHIPQFSQPWRAATLAGGGCALGYWYLAHASNLPSGIGLFEFLGGHFLITAILFGYYFYCARGDNQPGYAPIILWAVVFRIIGISGSPILEDDHFRYLLDGCVFVQTGTPYGISPASMFVANDLPTACQHLLSRVNNPALPTIYAPVLQFIFAAAHLISPVNIKVLQAVVSLFDLALIGLLCRYAPARFVMLYAWSPLLIKELSFTAHPDVIGVTLLMAAFHLRKLDRPGWAAGLMAMACAAKVFAGLLLPFLLFRLAFRYWLLCAAILAGLYLPFLLQGASDLAVLGVFVQRWQFNASLFLPTTYYFDNLWARALCFGLFALWWGAYFRCWARAKTGAVFPRGEWVFGVFLLFSPVLHPWYVVWLLPFAALRPQAWAWTLATAAPLAYVSGLHYLTPGLSVHQIAPWAYYAQVVAVAAALMVDGWRARRAGAD